MKRRIFLSAVFSILITTQVGYAKDRIFYSPGLAEAAIKEGKVVFLDFWTNWCTTCVAQDRVIRELRSSNQTYDSRITFITVNWDQYSNAQISKRLKELGVEDSLINLKGITQGMVVLLGQRNIKKLSDFADLSSDELIGGFDEIKGKKIRIDGYLEEFSLSREEADQLIMSAREIVFK